MNFVEQAHFAVLARSAADGVINYVCDAVQDELCKGINPLQRAPVGHSPYMKVWFGRQHQKVLHAAHKKRETAKP